MTRFLKILTTVVFVSSLAHAGETSFSHERYARVLDAHVNNQGFVDYAALKSDRGDLDAYVRSLGAIDPAAFETWPEPERLALLINAYNAFTLKLIIDHYPIQSSFWASLRYPKNSIRQISGAWDKITFKLTGRPITLGDLEHEVLRKRYREPRIHMAINCASVGCPPLLDEPYTAAKLDKQLAEQTRRFLANPDKFRINRANGDVYLSPIFKWFGEDFVKTHQPDSGFEGHGTTVRAVLNFVAQHVQRPDSAYLRTGRYDVSYLDYDWSLNEAGR